MAGKPYMARPMLGWSRPKIPIRGWDGAGAGEGASVGARGGPARGRPARGGGGSPRRGRETVGDLDLLVSGGDRASIAAYFVKHPRAAQVLAKGEDKVSVKLDNDLQVDVRLLERTPYGAAMQCLTGW